MKKKIITLLCCALPFICFGQWTQVGSTINGEAEGDESSISTAINAEGNVMAIGAWKNDDAGNNAGQARVYEWNGTDWIQRGGDLDGNDADDVFGSSVELSANGNVLAVGAPRFGVTPETPPGYVKVFEWNGTDWTQRGNDILGSENTDNAGSAISLSTDGSRVAIGASLNSVIGLFSGQTRIFEWDGSNWNQLGNEINGVNSGDLSGGSVFLSSDGNNLFIGETAGTADGRIRTFAWDGTNWIEGAEINDTVPGFGVINDIDNTGTVLLAGGMPGPMSQGITKIFEFDGTTWNQKGVTIEGDEGSDFLGVNAGKMNDDGSIIILGAVTGGLGYARVFSFDGNDWTQEGSDILGEGNAVQFGRSVTINSNGSMVAVGTRLNSEPNVNAGLVRVFENKTLGTSENLLASLKVYPNPIMETTTISAVEIIDTITIYNVMGQEIETLNFQNKKRVQIDMSSKAAGTYFARIESNGTSNTVKLIKK